MKMWGFKQSINIKNLTLKKKKNQKKKKKNKKNKKKKNSKQNNKKIKSRSQSHNLLKLRPFPLLQKNPLFLRLLHL